MQLIESIRSGRPFKLPHWPDWIFVDSFNDLRWCASSERAVLKANELSSEEWLIKDMGLQEALEKGKALRRHSWPEGKMIQVELTDDDVTARDWEVV